MQTSYSLLLNGQPHTDPTAVPVSGQAIILPRIQAARAAQELIWTILVERVTGAPTTASLRGFLQAGVRTTKGGETPPAGVGGGVGPNRYNYTDVAQQWFALNADADPDFLENDLPPVLADQTVSSGTLAASVALGATSLKSATQYPAGSTLNIGTEQFYVYAGATTSDAGATWDHPVISAGGPSGSGDTTDSTNLLKGFASKTHASGDTIHAPRRHFRRVRGGFDQRLVLVPSFTGGTNPTFIVTVDVRARG